MSTIYVCGHEYTNVFLAPLYIKTHIYTMKKLNKEITYYFDLFKPGLASWSQLELGVFGSMELEPLEKKTGIGAGAAWKKSQEPEPEQLEN